MRTCKGIEPSVFRRYPFFLVYIAYWIVLIGVRLFSASFLTEDSFEKESFLLQSISSSFICDDLNGNGSDMQHMLRLAAVQHKLLASKAATVFLSFSISLSLFLSVHFKTLFASQEFVEDVEDAPLSVCCGKGPQPSSQLVAWRGYEDSSVAIICSSAQSAWFADAATASHKLSMERGRGRCNIYLNRKRITCIRSE